MKSGIDNALELLHGELKNTVLAFGDNLQNVDEIRLRLGKFLSVVINAESVNLSYKVTLEDIEYAFKTAFSYSLHSYSKELANGYITTEGGNRVGLCGTAVLPAQNRDIVDTVKYISSINIRISREVKGYAAKLCNECLSDNICGVLIIGPPSSGKTTLLRDIARICGDRYKTSLVDELNEISYSYRGVPQIDVGNNTDVFVGYPRHVGVQTAVRVMSPQIIVCDEIGTDEDFYSLEYALHSGVKIISATHALRLEDALKKTCVSKLVMNDAFEYAAVLNPVNHSYEIKKMK